MASIPKFLVTAIQNVLSKAWRILQRDVRLGHFSLCKSTEEAEFHLTV